MKKLILTMLVCSQVLALSNATASKPAIFLTRTTPNPEKSATMGAFLLLSSVATFIPAGLVALSIKRHLAEGKTAADASASQAFAAVSGTVFAGATAFLWGQAFLSFADAAASRIFNPD